MPRPSDCPHDPAWIVTRTDGWRKACPACAHDDLQTGKASYATRMAGARRAYMASEIPVDRTRQSTLDVV